MDYTHKGKNVMAVMEYMNDILQGLKDNGLLWPAVFICTVVLLLLAWLLLRGVRLWYWKVNIQVDALRDINSKLLAFEGGIKEESSPAVMYVPPEPATPEVQSEEEEESISSIGRTGKVYTEEELKALIRD